MSAANSRPLVRPLHRPYQAEDAARVAARTLPGLTARVRIGGKAETPKEYAERNRGIIANTGKFRSDDFW
jgi:hypothetical protein